MTPGLCHPRLGRAGEATWAPSRRGGAEGRGCHQGQGWGGWVQPQHHPCVTRGRSGKGPSRFPWAESPGVGNRDRHGQCGDRGRGAGNKTFPVLEAFTLRPLLLPLPRFPQIPLVPPRIRVGWEQGWCLHSVPLPEKQGESQRSLKLQGFLHHSMLEVKNWERKGSDSKEISFPANFSLE